MTHRIIHADVLDWAAKYEGPKFHALICDPPWEYHFMSRTWDQTGITFQPETWAALAEHLLPGAFLMVFAGSRGWHRLACAMEDAGLVLQPSIFIWLQAQSFPKATRLCKAPNLRRQRQYRWLGWLGRLGNWIFRIRNQPPQYYLDFVWQGHRYGGQVLKDAASPIIVAQKPWTDPRLDCIVETGAGAINVDAGRIATGERLSGSGGLFKSLSQTGYQHGYRPKDYYSDREYPYNQHSKGRWPSNFCLVHCPPGPDGEGGCVRAGTRRVKGISGGGGLKTSDKNTVNCYGRYADRELPDIVGYADPDGYERVDAWRCEEGCVVRKLGEMSGDCRSAFQGSEGNTRAGFETKERQGFLSGNIEAGWGYTDKGTAARFYHQAGWEHERAECAAGCPVAKLDEQAGERRSSGEYEAGEPAPTAIFGNVSGTPMQYADKGGASRFYYNADWSHEIAERLATEAPVRYQPKAAKRERSEGLDDFYWRKDKQSPTGFVHVSKEEWEALGEEEQRVKAETGKRVSLRAQGNIHPTVKPLSLTEWLASLLSPPKEYAPRRLLVPFAGVASEMCGAILSRGFEEIVGVEMISDYVDIAEARAAFWSSRPAQPGLPGVG